MFPDGALRMDEEAFEDAATAARRPTANPDEISGLNLDWSPSGKQIVFEINREGQFGEEIFVMNAGGTRQTNPTKTAFFGNIGLIFSPNGTKISFERTNPSNGSRDLFTMRAHGNRQINLTKNYSVEANPSWQPMP